MSKAAIKARVRGALRCKPIARLGKFAVGSLVATAVSQIMLSVLFGVVGLDALPASMIAFVCGAIPSYLINRHWTWRTEGAPNRMVQYFVVMGTSGAVSAGLTSLASHLVTPYISDRAVLTVVLDVCFLGSFGVMLMVKFLVLNRFVFAAPGPRPPDGDASPHQAGRTEPVATDPRDGKPCDAVESL
ncbi:MAG: GtrA family protein [Sciscionella sp.]